MNSESKSPQEVKAELSRRIDQLMNDLFPEAVRHPGGKYSMATLEGGKGRSTSIYQGKRDGVYLVKDHSTDGEAINILELVHRHLGGSFSETMRWAHKFCGYSLLHTTKKEHPVTPLEIKDEPIRGTEVAKYMLTRKINERTLNKFNIFQQKSSDSVWWAAPLYDADGHARMIKYTNLNRTNGSKKIWSTKPVYNTVFGLHLVDPNATSKSVIICEGEIDAMSVYQMQKGDERIPVISVPSASNHAWIENCYDMLATMEVIYLAADMDQAGDAMVLTLSKRLGIERCKRVEIPYNDVNEWFVQDSPSEDDFLKLLAASRDHQSECLVKPSEYVIQMQDYVTQYEREVTEKNWLFQDMELSLRASELMVLSGVAGSGKSAIANQFASYLAKQNKKILFASFEIPIENVLFQLGHQLLGRAPLHEECGDIAAELGENMFFLDDQHFRDVSTNWQGLKTEIELAKKKFDVSTVFIDSYTYLSGKLDWSAQGTISKDLARTCIKNEVSIVLLAHADAKSKESSGGKFAATGMGNILGAQELTQAAHTICNIHRNIAKELASTEDEKRQYAKQGDATFSVFKQRNSGAIFSRDLWFDSKTLTFSTIRTDDNQ